MTDDDNLLARLTGFTPGTWELDPVKGDWMGGFYSGETPVCTFGDAQIYYPTEGEPPNYADAQLIAAAPDLHRIATELAAENKRLRDALSMLISMSDNHSPFGGEIYQDRVDRAWDNARAALKGGAA